MLLARGSRIARTYGPGKWSVVYSFTTSRIARPCSSNRIRRVLRSLVGRLGDDQDAWRRDSTMHRCRSTSPDKYTNRFRNAIIYYSGVHYERNGHLEFVHSVDGVRTLRDEFDRPPRIMSII